MLSRSLNTLRCSSVGYGVFTSSSSSLQRFIKPAAATISQRYATTTIRSLHTTKHNSTLTVSSRFSNNNNSSNASSSSWRYAVLACSGTAAIVLVLNKNVAHAQSINEIQLKAYQPSTASTSTSSEQPLLSAVPSSGSSSGMVAAAPDVIVLAPRYVRMHVPY